MICCSCRWLQVGLLYIPKFLASQVRLMGEQSRHRTRHVAWGRAPAPPHVCLGGSGVGRDWQRFTRPAVAVGGPGLQPRGHGAQLQALSVGMPPGDESCGLLTRPLALPAFAQGSDPAMAERAFRYLAYLIPNIWLDCLIR